MTILEQFLIIILWVIVGVWISYKRKWYKNVYDVDDYNTAICFNIIFAPILLVRVIFFQFVMREWSDKWNDKK